ncbi:hypothetical protein [Demequina maris]|uniref:hypothetical protein n=1 Tax=Demequina maris TaxID=1638982 RepID=UPI0007835573|nr:hypothetical protein [Demequina maris]
MTGPEAPETATRILTIDLPSALAELMIGYVRQQDSDLRLLKIVEAQVETPEQRDQRITAELVKLDPRVAPAQVHAMVAEVTHLYFEKIARGESLEDIISATQALAGSLAAKLDDDVDGVRFSWALLRACGDEPDSSRMRSNVLMGAMAGFEGLHLTVLRLLVLANGDRLAASPEERQARLAATGSITDADRAADAQEKIEAKSRNGWAGMQKAFRVFGIELPDQPEIIQVATTARNGAAHRNGALRDAMAFIDSAGSQQTVAFAADLTADQLRELLDTQIVCVLELVLAVYAQFDAAHARKAGAMLSSVQYVLLARGRDRACAATGHWHRRAAFEHDKARRTSQVNGWLALQRVGRHHEYMHDLAGWPRQPGSLSLELARLLLRGQRGEASTKAQLLRARGELPEREWETWPLFDGIRGRMTS